MRLRIHSSRTLLTLACLLPMVTPGALIASPAAGETQPAHRLLSRHKRPSVDDQVELLAKYLALNEVQQSSLKGILEQRQMEILAMRRAHASSDAPPTDTFLAIEDQTVERIRAMLNEEQRKKYDPLGARNSRSVAQQQSVEDWLKSARPR